jgi:hypothetical protein
MVHPASSPMAVRSTRTSAPVPLSPDLQHAGRSGWSFARVSIYPPENTTGLPDPVKAGMKTLSGVSLDDVLVHHNSSKPAAMRVLAYTQGNEIYVGPGQEQHLAHEAWHVVQQKQGRVNTLGHGGDMPINDDARLEAEADQAAQFARGRTTPMLPERGPIPAGVLSPASSPARGGGNLPIQMFRGQVVQDYDEVYIYAPENDTSFGLPEGVTLTPGDVVNFDIHNGRVVASSIQLITKPPTKLERIDVEETKGDFGEFRWKSHWQLGSPSLVGGYVIQDIVWVENYTTLKGNKQQEMEQYQEAWRVEPGAGYTKDFIADTIQWQKELQKALASASNMEKGEEEGSVELDERPYDDEIAQDEPIESREGRIIIAATARFYEGLVLPTNFTLNNKTLAEGLPSRKGIEHNDLQVPSITEQTTTSYSVSWQKDGKTDVKKKVT